VSSQDTREPRDGADIRSAHASEVAVRARRPRRRHRDRRPVTVARSRSSRAPARASIALLCAGILLAVAACGEPGRSASAYCATYDSGFDRIKQEHPDVDQYTHTSENPLQLLLSVTSAYGDIVALMGDMAKVAPDPVQTDVQRVHEALQKQIDSVGDAVKNPLGALASGFMTAITTSGAMTRMDTYTLQHCGEHMFSASPQ